MLIGLFFLGILICAGMAIFSRRLLTAALWLAGVSAQTAIVLYLVGLPEVAVIELSVGAGLVTILFVFAISIAGDATDEPVSRGGIWRSVAAVAALVTAVILAWGILPAPDVAMNPPGDLTFSSAVWEQRGLDTLLQVVLIATGSISVVALLASREQASETTEIITEQNRMDDDLVVSIPEQIESGLNEEVPV